MIDIVTKLQTHKPIKLVGHSLGGVLAILLSVELDTRKMRTTSVVSFGTPKFGCDKVRERISRRGMNIVRISNMNDPMVHLVPYCEFEVSLKLNDRGNNAMNLYFSMSAGKSSLLSMIKHGQFYMH